MSLLCILAGAAAVTLALPSERFTLAWTHSIEKTRWEEDYRVTGQGLVVEQARIRGSGAGMEPPPDARLGADGAWHYRPVLPVLAELALTLSPYAGDYEICIGGPCRPLRSLLPRDAPTAVLTPCRE